MKMRGSILSLLYLRTLCSGFSDVGTCHALHLTLFKFCDRSWVLSLHTYTTIRRNILLQALLIEASTPKPYRKQASRYHHQNQSQAACSSTPKTSIDIRIPTLSRKSLQWAFRRSMVLVSTLAVTFQNSSKGSKPKFESSACI